MVYKQAYESKYRCSAKASLITNPVSYDLFDLALIITNNNIRYVDHRNVRLVNYSYCNIKLALKQYM